MQRERAGGDGRDLLEQAVAHLRVHGADLRPAPDAPPAEIRARLDAREHRIRRKVAESAFGHRSEQGPPLAHPAGAEPERGIGGAPRQRRAGRGLLSVDAFRGDRGGGQVGGNRHGCNQAALGEREVAGPRGGG